MPWGSIRGHDRVVEQLRQAMAEGRFPHAWLFAGPEGVGKRAFALRLAQALLCERRPEELLDPCGTCPACVQVAGLTHPDLHVVGKPEDRHELPIAVIRSLCDELGLKASRGRRKVAILDDADDLNLEAANAFLKTLEEPAAGSVLILIGTAPELQLDTILSRCRVLHFTALEPADLAALLVEQGIVASPDEAARLAARAEGSLLRARGLADRVFNDFRQQLIARVAGGSLDAPAMARWLEGFIKDAGKESLAQRTRASLLFGELARFFRAVLWQTAGLEPPSADPEDREAAKILASRLDPEDVFLLADRCLQADYHLMRRVYLPVLLDAFTRDLANLVSPRP